MTESEDIDLFRTIIEKERNQFHEDFLKDKRYTISELESLKNIYEPGMEKGEVKFKADKKGGGSLKFNYIISGTKENVLKTLKVEDIDLAAFFAGLQAEVDLKKK